MTEVYKGKTLDKKCYHDPNICNIYGDTVASHFASRKIIPPKEWLFYNN